MSELTDRLTDVNGIGTATAEKITEAFDDVAELQETVADLRADHTQPTQRIRAVTSAYRRSPHRREWRLGGR